jgi:predicted Zn-dependent protease
VKAATSAFGDLKILEKELVRYANANSIGMRKIVGWKPKEGTVAITLLDRAGSDMMELRMRFVQGSDNKEEVDSFVRDARTMATRYPDHPDALELLAEGELDAENLAAATKANDALMALRPTDARAMLRKARIAAEQQRDKGDFPGGWAAVRRLVVNANKASPNDAFALATFYETFIREGVSPTENASLGLTRAVQLAPQVEWLRMALASNLLTRKQRAAAENVLRPLLNHPHNPEVREAARAMLNGGAPANDKIGDAKSISKEFAWPVD